ncbi:hypothetical protein KEM55_002582 [Ascosphaera atra]|nr:hypothetical protein KEM55_002582 [Ascosphaera atra]
MVTGKKATPLKAMFMEAVECRLAEFSGQYQDFSGNTEDEHDDAVGDEDTFEPEVVSRGDKDPNRKQG